MVQPLEPVREVSLADRQCNIRQNTQATASPLAFRLDVSMMRDANALVISLLVGSILDSCATLAARTH